MNRKERMLQQNRFRPTRREILAYGSLATIGGTTVKLAFDQCSQVNQPPPIPIPTELRQDINDLQLIINESQKIPKDNREIALLNKTRDRWLDLLDKPYNIHIQGKIALALEYLRISNNKLFRDTAISMAVQNITSFPFIPYSLTEPLVRRDSIQTPQGTRMGIVISSVRLAADLEPEGLLLGLVRETKALELLGKSGMSSLDVEAISRAQRHEAYLLHHGLTGLTQIDLNTQESQRELRELAQYIRCKKDQSGSCWRDYIEKIPTPTPPLPTPQRS